MTPSDNDDKWDARSSLRRRINDAARTTRNGWDGMEGWKERGVTQLLIHSSLYSIQWPSPAPASSPLHWFRWSLAVHRASKLL
ncbi:hypothetical protein TYRP_005541 [Tyrophagus putrescentiae]|nr:hypothetical protein TYRP_005541 [Tyrophagus putrescentiae]